MNLDKAMVDFMIIGAQKSATTTLFDILKTHPQLVACKKKEPEFFSHTSNWDQKIEAYEALYNKQEGQLAFEASTAYTAHPTYNRKIWEALQHYNPSLKFIYIVRDPLERIKSAHRFLYRQGYASDKNINTFMHSSAYHTNLSKYYYQIKPYIDLFGADQVKIVLFEDFVKSQETTVNELLRFLNVSDFNEFTPLKSNTKGRKLVMKTGFGPLAKLFLKVKSYLPYRVSKVLENQLMYRKIVAEDLEFTPESLLQLEKDLLPDILKFEKLINRDLSHWKRNLNNV